MALFASINDFPLQGGTLTFPFYGAWVADINVASGGSGLTGPVTLALAGITLQGFVFRGGDFAGSTKYRICGGAGWQQVVSEHPYRNPFGLRLSVVLHDVAKTVGESVEIQTGLDLSFGAFYLRQKAPASQVLRQLAPHWWIRNDGVTQIGERGSPIIKSKFELLQGTDLGLGRMVIGTEKPEDWVPGSVFTSITVPQKRISGVTHRWAANKLQTVVWTTP